MQVRFGEFMLDTESRQLLRDKTDRHLSPKAFELLHLLLESRPRALSKAELHSRLWPSTFVSDATLSSLVAEVRAALGETARPERFVRTVHRFGYAFRGTATDLTSRTPASDHRPRCCVIWEWGQVRLDEGEYLLGRDADVAVWLESPTVSRHHARIRVRGPEVTIEDLGSKNGTYLRGERLTKPLAVMDGDEIELGSISVKVRLFDTSGSTDTRRSGERGRTGR
jgi:DNA-binding winged helix-turn-helix (wHTH) protein